MENGVWKRQELDETEETLVPPLQENSIKPNSVAVDIDNEIETEKTKGIREPGYKRKGIIYGVDDRPPFQIAIICAFQVSTRELTIPMWKFPKAFRLGIHTLIHFSKSFPISMEPSLTVSLCIK